MRSWLDIIFGRDTQESIKLRGIENELDHFMKHRQYLRGEIRNFKDKFRHGTITTSPEKYLLHSVFPNKNIDDLTLRELCDVGFISENLWRSDFKIKKEEVE